MTLIKEKLLKLVGELFVDASVKQGLVLQIQAKGITREILIKVQSIIDQSVGEYKKEVQEEIDFLKREMSKTQNSMKEKELEKNKNQRLKQESIQLNDLRRKLKEDIK